MSSSGDPIPATVLLDRRASEVEVGDPMQATCDSRGRYRFEHVPNGACRLTVLAAGFATRVVHVTKDDDAAVRLDVILDRGKMIRGRVVDASGRPAGGWRIQVAPRGDDDIDELLERTVLGQFISADDGSFTIVGLVPGAYSLVLLGHSPEAGGDGGPRMIHSDEVVAHAGEEGVVLRVRPMGELRGKIEFKGDDPPEYFTITSTGAPQKFCGSDGTFVVRASVVGKIPLVIEAPGFATAYLDSRIPESGFGEISVEMFASGRLRGRVVKADGSPVPGAVVTVLPSRDLSPRAWFASPSAWTGKDGKFLLENMRSGDVILAVHTPGLAYTYAGPFDAYPGRDLPLVEISLKPGVKVSGRARFADQPLADAMVILESVDLDHRVVDAFWIRSGARSDATGAFAIGDVKPGSYVLRVTAAFGPCGLMATRTMALSVPETGLSALDVDLGDGEASLVLELPESAPEGWFASLVSEASSAAARGQSPHRAYSRSARGGGRVVFERVPPGVYTLEVVANDEGRRAYERDEAPVAVRRRLVTIDAGEDELLLDLRDDPMTNTR